MTPEQIAAKMTPAQVRALRDPMGNHQFATIWIIFSRFGLIAGWPYGERIRTPLGLAVLAALDKDATP